MWRPLGNVFQKDCFTIHAANSTQLHLISCAIVGRYVGLDRLAGIGVSCTVQSFASCHENPAGLLGARKRIRIKDVDESRCSPDISSLAAFQLPASTRHCIFHALSMLDRVPQKSCICLLPAGLDAWYRSEILEELLPPRASNSDVSDHVRPSRLPD